MKYYIIRRRLDKVPYGRNLHWKTTGNKYERHGFNKHFQPYLYSTYERAFRSLSINKVIMTEHDVEICEVSLTVKSIMFRNYGEK